MCRILVFCILFSGALSCRAAVFIPGLEGNCVIDSSFAGSLWKFAPVGTEDKLIPDSVYGFTSWKNIRMDTVYEQNRVEVYLYIEQNLNLELVTIDHESGEAYFADIDYYSECYDDLSIIRFEGTGPGVGFLQIYIHQSSGLCRVEYFQAPALSVSIAELRKIDQGESASVRFDQILRQVEDYGHLRPQTPLYWLLPQASVNDSYRMKDLILQNKLLPLNAHGLSVCVKKDYDGKYIASLNPLLTAGVLPALLCNSVCDTNGAPVLKTIVAVPALISAVAMYISSLRIDIPLIVDEDLLMLSSVLHIDYFGFRGKGRTIMSWEPQLNLIYLYHSKFGFNLFASYNFMKQENRKENMKYLTAGIGLIVPVY